MQGFEFMLHQMISTTVVTRFWLEPEISTPNKKSVTCSSFLLPQDVLFSGQSSGTSIWVLQVSVSYQNVYLLANQHTPVFSGTDCTLLSEANPALNSNTPKGWEVQPPGSLAPWVNVQRRPTGPNGTGLSSIAPPTMPRCLACPGREML